MPLLSDYAITPDVFDVASYPSASKEPSEEICRLQLRAIRDVLTTKGLVRSLHSDKWFEELMGSDKTCRWGKELLKKLKHSGRLISCPGSEKYPDNNFEWCEEALAAHDREHMNGGVIVTGDVKSKKEYESNDKVQKIDRLDKSSWWPKSDQTSIRLRRNLSDYKKNLDLVLRYSKSLTFIDPYLFPPGNPNLAKLLEVAGNRNPSPEIEIHCTLKGSKKNGEVLDLGNFKRMFRTELNKVLSNLGLSAKVFVWHDFHDRFLISNLIGISLPIGFDTSHPKKTTTWTLLSREDRESVQREFLKNSKQHKLLDGGQFTIS